LRPELANGFAFAAKDGRANATIEDGHLQVNYGDGPLSLSVDDEYVWQANYSADDTKLHVRGDGMKDMTWDISKQRVVDGMGVVGVNADSDKRFSFLVEPFLPKVRGVQLKANARSNSADGIHWHLGAQRQLPKNLALEYTVEGSGDLALENLAHEARLDGEFGKENKASVVLTHNADDALGYNATFTRDLSTLAGPESGLTIGADDFGVYGNLTVNPTLGKGLRASYNLAGRADHEEEPEFAHSIKLSHDLGTLKLSQASDEDVEALFESDVKRGANRAQASVGYTVGDDIPTFNVSLTRELTDALKKLSTDGEVQIGIDDASVEGLYGRVSAARKFDNGIGATVSSGGRLNAMEHSMTVSNKLGYAQLLKSPKHGNPRLRVGYQFDA
jgi:hypothetical protein